MGTTIMTTTVYDVKKLGKIYYTIRINICQSNVCVVIVLEGAIHSRIAEKNMKKEVVMVL
jgi:hypothetical protein